MTTPIAPGAYRELHDATLEFLEARTTTQLWQALLGSAISLIEGHGGSFWVPDSGALKRIMVGGTDELAREVDRLEGDDQERLSADAQSSLALARTIRTPEKRVVGVIRLCRDRGDGPLSEGSVESLAAMITLAGFVAGTLVREGVLQSKARDFNLVAELSREVTATLDLDRVLRAVVNLASRALTFDRGALALYEDGHCDIRAVSGADKVDANDSRLRDLAERAAWAAGRGAGLYVSDREDPATDDERVFLQFFKGDLEADEMRSGLYLPLRDEEGIVGILVLEAQRAEFATEHQRDVAEILANQATVAIRNARLYSQVPLVDVLGAIGERRRAFRQIPKRKKQMFAAAVVAGLAALTLIRWPLRVDGQDPTLLPAERVIVRPLVDGQVEQVLVRTGERVEQGAPLLQLRVAERRGARDAMDAEIVSAEREASLAASRADAVGERLARAKAETARLRRAVLTSELNATVIRAPAAGIVLTERTEELLEQRALAGAPLLMLGRTDSLEVTFTVPQRDVARVTSAQRVRLRAEALPQQTFEGRVLAIAPLPAAAAQRLLEMPSLASTASLIASDTSGSQFTVRALVANPGQQLRPGMRSYVRVLTGPASLAERLLRHPLRSARLLLWRLTA
ncbi:efflux RND transporter periplasmic adaptor subunit [Gemmatimonas sp.]|uniref:efflux RND transporter periplasmic adaptor subunit n=1 Tax=Gemmatimonas sp. TaxID=1962908 RepID=UPI0039830053